MIRYVEIFLLSSQYPNVNARHMNYSLFTMTVAFGNASVLSHGFIDISVIAITNKIINSRKNCYLQFVLRWTCWYYLWFLKTCRHYYVCREFLNWFILSRSLPTHTTRWYFATMPIQVLLKDAHCSDFCGLTY